MSAPMPPLAVLFDLDGTLVQTREASWKIFARTNAAFALGVDTQEKYFKLLEQNLFTGLRKLCRDEAQAQEAASHFLAQLDADYMPAFVPGIVDVVRALAGNCSLAVVSSNTTATIRRLLIQAGVAHCFSHVFGGDVESDKRAVLRRFLADRSYLINRDCSPAYREGDGPAHASASDLALVTDTTGDVIHAKECGAAAIGVAWGMHSEAALKSAGADFVALWPQEIVARLLPGGFSGQSCGVHPQSSSGCRSAVPSACSCEPVDLAEAGAVRRERNLSRTNALAASLRKTTYFSAAPLGTRQASADLRRSLQRLRGAPALSP
jgi:phosphoglycolate phosphatase